MQWKKVWSEERTAETHVTVSRPDGADISELFYPDGGMIVPIPRGCSGARIRVTVDEAVDDCCEKWRGSRCAPSLTALSIQPSFCPECGKKL